MNLIIVLQFFPLLFCGRAEIERDRNRKKEEAANIHLTRLAK